MAVTQIKDGYAGGSDNQLKVNSDGSINVTSSGGGGSSTVKIEDTAGNPLTSTSGALNITGTVTVSGAVTSSGTSTVSGTVSTNLNGLAAFQTSQYTVGTSAVQLTVTPLTNRSSMSIKVKTAGSNDLVYIGGTSGVTSSTGYVLFNGDSLQLDITGSHSVYVIGSASGQTVYVLEVGN